MKTINTTKTAQACELEFSDGSKFVWNGYLSASVNEGSVGEALEMVISVQPSTVPQFITA